VFLHQAVLEGFATLRPVGPGGLRAQAVQPSDAPSVKPEGAAHLGRHAFADCGAAAVAHRLHKWQAFNAGARDEAALPECLRLQSCQAAGRC